MLLRSSSREDALGEECYSRCIPRIKQGGKRLRCKTSSTWEENIKIDVTYDTCYEDLDCIQLTQVWPNIVINIVINTYIRSLEFLNR
jgi:hypothetical protein